MTIGTTVWSGVGEGGETVTKTVGDVFKDIGDAFGDGGGSTIDYNSFVEKPGVFLAFFPV